MEAYPLRPVRDRFAWPANDLPFEVEYDGRGVDDGLDRGYRPRICGDGPSFRTGLGSMLADKIGAM